MPQYLKHAAAYANLLSKYDTFLFDLDGVIWNGSLGNDLTPNIAETLAYLRQNSKKLAFVTNNSTKSRSAYRAKFRSLGIPVAMEEIYSCGSASATFLRDVILPAQPVESRGVYVIGQRGLEEELEEVGITWKGGSAPEDDVLMPYQDFTSIQPDPSIGVVLFSFNMHLNYQQLAKAYNYLASNPNCKLVLTNDDSTVLLPSGGKAPGEGATASVLFGARKGLKPIVVGKPHTPMLDAVQRSLRFDPARTIMIGDRLETDILFGIRGGISTLLVLTGSSQLNDLAGLPTECEPTYVTNCVGDLLKGVSAKPLN